MKIYTFIGGMWHKRFLFACTNNQKCICTFSKIIQRISKYSNGSKYDLGPDPGGVRPQPPPPVHIC